MIMSAISTIFGRLIVLMTIEIVLVFSQVHVQSKHNILFLMVDEMDGRNMDQRASDQYNAIEMPNLRAMATKGTQFVGHYTNGPQCVCGRSVFWTGRRTNDIKVYNNAFGIAASFDGTIDDKCISTYDLTKCQQMRTTQAANYTILNAMQLLGYDVFVYGKLHVGAGVMDMPSQSNATSSPFEAAHTPNSLASLTRSANINKPTTADPMTRYNDNTADPHSSDEAIIQKCIQRLNAFGAAAAAAAAADAAADANPWMLYCSVNIPHPPFQTNSSWLNYVNMQNIKIPSNLNSSHYNKFDEYTSKSEDCWNEEWSTQDIIDFRKTYYGLNGQTDFLLGTVMDTLFSNDFHLNNTYVLFTSDHGEMNLEHRQYTKNSLYEGSARIPLFIAGPSVAANRIITNFTQMIDILPTLIDIAGGYSHSELRSLSASPASPALPGSSLMPFTNGHHNNSNNAHPNYITSQYHSLKANTGSFMVRKDAWKYIQYGHYLSAFEAYEPQLFNLDSDPNEILDVSEQNPDVVKELENLLLSTYNYEYADCVAKQNDLSVFNEFVWNIYNETQIYQFLSKTYQGFNQNNWEKIVNWRQELQNATPCDALK